MTRGQDYRFATSLYAQSARGGGLFPVDELLSEREKIQEQIAAIVGEKVRHWGLTVEAIQLQDFDLPEDLKQVMSCQATAEWEKRATITKVQGDRVAAMNPVEAAKLIAETAWPVAFPMELGHALASLGRAKATGFRSTQP